MFWKWHYSAMSMCHAIAFYFAFLSCSAVFFPSLSSSVTLNILTISWNCLCTRIYRTVAVVIHTIFTGIMTLLIIISGVFCISVVLRQFISFFPCVDVVPFVSNAHKPIQLNEDKYTLYTLDGQLNVYSSLFL